MAKKLRLSLQASHSITLAMPVTSLQNSESMSEFTLGQLRVLKSKTKHRHALLYFHGFPGPYEVLQPGEFRIVDALHDDIVSHYDLYYPLYTLKHAGPFSFEETLQDGLKVLNYILEAKQYESIVLVGQSWGAVIAMAVSREYNFEKILLITPFLSIPSGEGARLMFNYYSEKYPELLPRSEAQRFEEQIESIRCFHNPKEALLGSSSKICVFAAENDEIISLKKIYEAVKDKRSIEVILLPNQTHKVEDRFALQSRFRNALPLHR